MSKRNKNWLLALSIGLMLPLGAAPALAVGPESPATPPTANLTEDPSALATAPELHSYSPEIVYDSYLNELTLRGSNLSGVYEVRTNDYTLGNFEVVSDGEITLLLYPYNATTEPVITISVVSAAGTSNALTIPVTKRIRSTPIFNLTITYGQAATITGDTSAMLPEPWWPLLILGDEVLSIDSLEEGIASVTLAAASLDAGEYEGSFEQPVPARAATGDTTAATAAIAGGLFTVLKAPTAITLDNRNAEFSGSVTAQYGTIPSGQLELKNVKSGAAQSVEIGADGSFSFPGITAGNDSWLLSYAGDTNHIATSLSVKPAVTTPTPDTKKPLPATGAAAFDPALITLPLGALLLGGTLLLRAALRSTRS